MSNALKMLMRGGAAKESDPDFENTVLLLHGDGNQGATNFSNTGPTKYMAFTDNSTNNFPITVNGDAYGDNFSPFSRDEGAWSNFFDGSGDYLSIASNSALSWGTGDYTVEAWVYLTAATSRIMIVSGIGNFAFFTNSSRQVVVGRVGADELVSTGTVPLNAWTHIAATRSSNTTRIFIDGVSAATPTSITTNYGQNTTLVGSDGSNHTSGFISGFRAVKGTAVYTSAFTPSTTPLTAISGTSLLTCQSNRFKDNSSNNFAITRNGDVTVSPFTPFTVTPNTTDGSGYFNGSGAYLTAPSNAAFDLGTGDFTIEGWGYRSSGSGWFLYSSSTTSFTVFSYADGNIQVYSGGFINSGINPGNNNWFHVAVVRSSGTLRIYVNGVQGYSGSFTTNLTQNSPFIGQSVASEATTGYISNVRVVKGTAVYTAAFTPPSAPVTAVSGTSLLTCQYQGTVRNVGFIDSSPYDHRITRVGNTTQGSFSPFSKPDGRWGNYFDGSGDFLTAPNNAVFDFGSGDFTLEAWVYSTIASGEQTVYFKRASNTNYGPISLQLNAVSGTNRVTFIGSTTGSSWNIPFTSGSTPIPTNTWAHIAVVRSGTNIYGYVNGVRDVTVSGISGALMTNSDAVSIGAGATGGQFPFYGYLSNVRIIKGTALYTGATYTVPVGPLTSVSGTSLLTCQSNRFKDNSTNNFTITRNGDVKVTPFSPFPITTAYDPAVNGGSGYFDGNDDYLSIPYSGGFELGSSDFTVEGWMHIASSTIFAPMPLISFRSDTNSHYGFSVSVNNGYLSTAMSTNGSSWALVSSSTDQVKAECWNHFAIVRSGSNIYAYTNGVRYTMSTTYSGNVYIRPDPVLIGRSGTGGNYQYQLTGYISGLRVAKTAVYTASSFTPPTAPPTPIANTTLLCNFTNAGIFDNTGFNNLETVGNAQIDTSVKKYGTGAMKFDGTGDYLIAPNNPTFDMTGASYCFEAWIYTTNASKEQSIFNRFDGQSGPGLSIQRLSSGIIIFFTGSQLNGVTVVPANTWTHIACTFDGTTKRIFINGVLDASATGGTTWQNSSTNTAMAIGHRPSDARDFYFVGYMDDIRITRGLARYTSNFTPPAKAFPDIGV